MPEIRRCGADDAALLAELEKSSFSDPWSEQSLRDHLSLPHGLAFTARLDGAVCGYLIASLLWEEGEVMRIATLPPYRKRGVARALLSALKKEAREQGAVTLFLEVRKENLAARRLYEAEGFVFLGERRNYYRDPADDAVLYQYTTSCEEMQ